ncbi:hypothetical protein OU790_16285 [Ruegeria sp. NA]|nr:hypothetical protein [Ruegeria sp. NA]MCX8954985.1 hypothetical protein [Ruegeria sp. NA]
MTRKSGDLPSELKPKLGRGVRAGPDSEMLSHLPQYPAHHARRAQDDLEDKVT